MGTPAGFIDYEEDPRDAPSARCNEETGLVVRITGIIDVLGSSKEGSASIALLFRGEMIEGTLMPGDDVDDARFVSLDEIDDYPIAAFESTHLVSIDGGQRLYEITLLVIYKGFILSSLYVLTLTNCFTLQNI